MNEQADLVEATDENDLGASQTEVEQNLEETENQDVENQNGEEAPESAEEPKEPDTPFPKKAINAISRRDKQIGKLRAQMQQYEQELERLRQSSSSTSEQNKMQAPNEDDFDNYGEFLLAQFEHKQAQKNGDQSGQNLSPEEIKKQAYQQAQNEVHMKQRLEHVDQQIDKAREDIPDFSQLEAEYEDVLTSFPQQILRVLLDADNAPMAFYALAKEGKLENLSDMNPHMAAMEIAKAEIRGMNMIKSNKVSKAPQPIKGARAASTAGNKPIDANMSEAELEAWLNS